jgi:hypothetical protein
VILEHERIVRADPATSFHSHGWLHVNGFVP